MNNDKKLAQSKKRLDSINAEVSRLEQKLAKAKIRQYKAFLDFATAKVATWPDWKQGVLNNSSKSTNDTPRKPVMDDEPCY